VVLRNVQLARYTTPTVIQSYTIPAVLQGNDVVAVAQTGKAQFVSPSDGPFSEYSQVLARPLPT
jgi:ATP-dependent RNA helicase DDX3X